MSELRPLPCPICGAELKIYSPEDWHPTFSDPDSGGDPYAAACDCGFNFSTGTYDCAEFIAALNRRTQPNEPLSLEELRGMDGEPVYTVPDRYAPGWDVVKILDTGYIRTKVNPYLQENGYGKTWLTYRRKPEGGEG